MRWGLVLLAVAALLVASVLSFPSAFGLTRSSPLQGINKGPGFLLSARLPDGLPRLRDRMIFFPDVPVVLEDGQPLGFAMAARKEIENGGYGRYRIAGEAVLFSTRDGAPPDGKQFVIVSSAFQLREPILLGLWALALLLAGVALSTSLDGLGRFLRKWEASMGLILSLGIVTALALRPASTADQFFEGLAVPILWALSLGALAAGRAPRWGVALLITSLYPAAAAWIHYGVNAASHDSFLVAGTIPWSDAWIHFVQAGGIALDGHTPAAFNGRFLYPAYFSGLLRITNFHLQAANFLVSAAVLASLALVCVVVRERISTLGTAAFAALCWLYFRVYGCGLVMTEGLGLACGLLGLACLLQASQNHRNRLLFLGIFMLAVGSSARPGALFVLPALALHAGIQAFQTTTPAASWFHRLVPALGALVLSLALVGAAFLSNRVMMGALYEGQPQAFGNFAFTLNGLLTGTKWDVSYEATNGDSAAVMSENVRLLRSEPGRLLSGISRAYGELLEKGFLFRFGAEKRLAHAALILAALGLAACWIRPGLRADALWLTLAAAGIFASIPFAPPWDAEVRPYAATVPIQSLLPGIGIFFLVFLWKHSSAQLAALLFAANPPSPAGSFAEHPQQEPPIQSQALLTGLACAALLTMVFPVPLALARFPAHRPPDSWPPDFRPGSFVTISANSMTNALPLPAFRSGLANFAANRPQEGRDIASIEGNFILGINWNDLKSYAIALPLPLAPPAFQPNRTIQTDPALGSAQNPLMPTPP